MSIIVVTYNQEKYIARTLDAILAQKCDFTYEIIVSDDCSNDRTADICKEYANKFPDKIRFIQNKTNKGLISNYYGAIDLAKGKYLADCGGDDVWYSKDKLQRQVDILESDNSIVLAHTDWNYYSEITGKQILSDPKGYRKKYHTPLIDGAELFIPLLTHTYGPLIHTSSMVWRNDVFKECRAEYPGFFDNPEWTCEDLQLVVALSRKGKVAFIPEVCLLYSIDKPSITFIDDPEKIYRFYIGSLRLTRYMQQSYGIDNATMHKCFLALFRYLLAQAFVLNDPDKLAELTKIKTEYEIKLPFKVYIKLCLAKFRSAISHIRHRDKENESN